MVKRSVFCGITSMVIVLMVWTADAELNNNWLQNIFAQFADPGITIINSGDLRATIPRANEDTTRVKMNVRKIRSGRPNDGFAGFCIENRPGPVPLADFQRVSAMFRTNTVMTVAVKLEKTRHEDGIVWLENKKRLKIGDNEMQWDLGKSMDTSTGKATLDEVRRLCVYVTADRFPAGSNGAILEIGPFSLAKK